VDMGMDAVRGHVGFGEKSKQVLVLTAIGYLIPLISTWWIFGKPPGVANFVRVLYSLPEIFLGACVLVLIYNGTKRLVQTLRATGAAE